jgi:hypothetical protein
MKKVKASEPKITPLGVYKVYPDKEQYKYALTVHDDAEYVEKELGSLVLVELKIENDQKKIDITDFKQAHTEYVPYDEIFYSIDYNNVIAKAYEKPKVNDYVVCFYLHFYDPGEQLVTPFGQLDMPSVTELPDRFNGMKYIYWD